MTGLNDKTVVMAGPFGLLMQNLVTRITEHGSDVALLTDDVKSAQRVCQNIMDMREVSEKFGRATAIDAQVDSEKGIENAFSRSAELFGSTDIYIDTHLFNLNIPFLDDSKLSADEIQSEFTKKFEQAEIMTKVASTFLKARSRGRILYLFHELDLLAAEKVQSKVFTQFAEYVKSLALKLAEQNTSVNALAVGVSEEYLLSHFTKSSTIQGAHRELIKVLPHAKIVDYNEIANFTSFIVSPLSSGLSGQVIRLDHGL